MGLQKLGFYSVGDKVWIVTKDILNDGQLYQTAVVTAKNVPRNDYMTIEVIANGKTLTLDVTQSVFNSEGSAKAHAYTLICERIDSILINTRKELLRYLTPFLSSNKQSEN